MHSKRLALLLTVGCGPAPCAAQHMVCSNTLVPIQLAEIDAKCRIFGCLRNFSVFDGT